MSLKSKNILDNTSANFKAMNEHLQNEDWSPVFTASDVNVAVDYFHSLVLNTIELFIPKLTSDFRGENKSWYRKVRNWYL